MLKSLDVSFNSIVEIPEEIGSAASLVKYVFLVFSPVLMFNALFGLRFRDFDMERKIQKTKIKKFEIPICLVV